MNVNSDEAAVLGAALHGATLSRQFRTKNIKLFGHFSIRRASILPR